MSVDEAVGRVLDALDAPGVADDTLVLFTSDNGLLFGEHGGVGKGVPYEESIRVPLVVAPGADVAPAPLGRAGQPARRRAHAGDAGGRALRIGRRQPGAAARLAALPRPPVVPLEFEASMGLTQGYRGFRFRNFKWVVWDDGRFEAYDLRRDPWELRGRNAVAAPRPVGADRHLH